MTTKGKSPAYRWYPKDILGSLRVAAMTAAEECWYRRALDFAWLNSGLPSDPVKLSRIIGKKCNVAGAKMVLEMFTPSPDNPDVFINERQEIERQKQKEWSEKSSNGGKKSRPKEKQEESKSEPPLEVNPEPKANIPFAVSVSSGNSSIEDFQEGEEPEQKPPDPPRFGPPENVPPPNSTFHHPVIKAFREVTSYHPPAETHQLLIDKIGQSIDRDRLKKANAEWLFAGNRARNFEGIADWYLGNKKYEKNGKAPSNVGRYEPQKDCDRCGGTTSIIEDGLPIPCPDCDPVNYDAYCELRDSERMAA